MTSVRLPPYVAAVVSRTVDTMPTSSAVALGFRVKSGYAIAVAVQGPASDPTVIARKVVELSDPEVGETRQPYHHGFYTHEKDAKAIARLVKIVERCAKQSVAALIDELHVRAGRAGLVVGSVIDPAQVGNLHIRAHASEGLLFRTVLCDALRSHGLECDVIVQKQLAARAAARLRRSDGEINRVLSAFGKAVGSPWRADEKAASTAAWILL